MMGGGAFMLLLTALSGVLADGISPVQKVIQLIDDFAAKVQKDQDASSKVFEEAAKFCDDEAVAKGYAIKDSNKDIESLSALIEDEKAKISQSETNIEEASGRISATEGELYDATSLRDKEHADFVTSEKELVATVSTLEGAIDVLKKAMSMTQLTSEAKSGLDKVVAGLSSIVDASFVTHAQRDKVQAFLQSREDADDNLSLSQTASKSGGTNAITEAVEEMLDKAEGTLADVRKEEMQSNHAFMMLKQGMENQIKSNTEELNENTKAKQVSTETLASATNDLSTTKKALSEDTAYLADLKRDCQVKAREWEVEHKDSIAELTALSSAKGVLTQKFKVAFLESQATLTTAHDDNGDDNKARALRDIEQLGRKLKSTALISLAYRASEDPFGKVRGMVEDMIAKLLAEAAEEATQKAFCDEEMGASNKSKENKEEKLEKTNARIEKSESSMAMLKEQVAVLSEEIAEIDSSQAEATSLRQKENSVYRAAEKDFSESQEACASALEILREYYEGASLVQTDRAVTSGEKSDGSGIIGLLEVAESDFAKSLAEARTSENVAADEYKKLEQDNKMSKVTKEVEVKGKQSELKSLKVALANSNEDKDGLSTELDAVLEYLKELKPQCEIKAPSYAERKAKRESEIEGLKDALEVLEQ